MPTHLEEHSFEKAMNDFIDSNVDDRLLVDLENPECRLTSPKSKTDSSSDKSSRTGSILTNLKNAIKDGSQFEKQGPAAKFRSISSRSSTDRNEGHKTDRLEHAEAVIEYQRERINNLENTLEKFNAASSKTDELHRLELDRYEKDNKEMRLQMQNVIADYDAITKRYQVDMGEFEALKGKCLQNESELLKRDTQIKELSKKLELLPKENEMLKLQKQELLQEVKTLRNELFPNVKNWQRNYDPFQPDAAGAVQAFKGSDPLKTYNMARRTSPELAMPHVVCDVRKQETAAMGRCLMQVENELSSFKRLYEDQRSEIQRLNNLLASKTKTVQFEGNPYFGSHKQLMYLRDVFVSMVNSSNQLNKDLKVTKEEPAQHEDRSLHAAYMLKSSSEQREMYDKLLDVVRNMISVKSSTTSFYRCKADYCKLAELNDFDLDLKFNRMLVEVDDAKVLVHQLDDDQIVYTEIISLHNLRAVRPDFKNLQFTLKDDHFHVFRLPNSDSYNRLYYGLQYAGFLMDDTKMSIYSSVDLTYLGSEENWPQDLVPVLFSKVVTFNNQRNAMNMNIFGHPFNFNPALPLNQQPMYNAWTTPDYQLNNLLENITVISEFTSSLLYFDQSSGSFIIYGPNLANKPKLLNPENTYKFTVTNNLEYSSEEVLLESEGENADEKFVDSYLVPFATFPNGEPVLSYFNPQLTNYSLASLKNEAALANKMAQMNVVPSDFSSPMSAASPMNLFNEFEFDVYFLLPLNPKYNDHLTKLMGKADFLRLKVHQPEVPSDRPLVIPDVDKFYKFVDGVLHMDVKQPSEEPFKIPCQDGYYRVDEETNEITLSSLGTDDTLSLTFSINNLQLLRQFVGDLDLNGFTQLQGDATSGTGQVCIVTKGHMQIFNRLSANPTVPFAIFQPENTVVDLDEKLRTIVITQNTDTKLSMSLDCLKPSVFERWKSALMFGGFMDSELYDGAMGESTMFKEFKFDIKIFEEGSHEKRSFKITDDKMCIVTTPNAREPFFSWNKADMIVELYPDNRRIRVYLKRHSKHEERFDLIMPILPDYQNAQSTLEKYNYRIEQAGTKPGLRYHYIVSKPGHLHLHKTKYDKDPLLTFGSKSYDAFTKSDTYTITFRPRVRDKSAIKLTFKKEEMFKKFVLALKVANFLPFTREKMPLLFFPSIVYSFACPDAKRIFKDCRI